MTDTGWLTDEQQQAWRAYRRMVLLVDAQIARELTRDSGLSMPDYQVLSALSEDAEHQQRLSELAVNMQWSASRLSHHVSRMEQRGLVHRAGCDSDARGAFVLLTGPGLDAIKAAAPDHVESVRRHLINLLTPEQITALAEIGQTVIAPFGERCPGPIGRPADGQPGRPAQPGQSAKRSPDSRSYAST
ncbi:MAG: MarR family winged helix-turn-helix transcriptional regulator [Jatrophihabitantaceae bacterium]